MHNHIHTKARQELMPPIFILCYLQVRHEKISKNLPVTLLRAKLFFNIISIFVNILPRSDKSIHSCQVEVSLLPLQCHIICVLVSSQVVFQRNRGVEMWWCVVRTAGWVLYHFPFLWWPHWFIHFCVFWCYKGGRNTLTFSLWDRLNKGKHWDFLVFHYSKLHCWSPRL